MKELLGTSYYFLRQYFGKDVPATGYDDFIPQNLKEKQSLTKQETGAVVKDIVVEDILGVQAVGSTVLENKKGEEIAQLTFTELPTLYSNMTTSSVGLEFVPGRIVEDKVTKISVAAKSRPMTQAVEPSGQFIQNQREQEQEEEKDDDTEYEDYEGLNEEEEKEEEIQPPIQQTEILIAKEQQIKQELQEVIKETAANEVIQQQEQQYKLEQIKQMLAIATGNKDVAERKLKEAQENYNKSGFIGFGKSDTLEQIMDEKQKEKEKADQEYKTWYDRYLEATKEERERKMREKEEAEKQKRYEKLDDLLNQTQQEEREKDAAAKIRAYIAKRKEAAEKQKDEKEAAEKQKRYEEVVAQLEEIEQKEKEAKNLSEKDSAEAEKQSLLNTLEQEEGPLDLGEISLVEDTEESNRQAVSEAAKKAVNTIHFLGLNSAEAILQAQRQLAEKERLTQEEDTRKKAIETLLATVESGVGKNRAEVEQKTKDILTQAKQQLENKKREKDAFDLSNLDSIEKIESLRQKNKSFKDSLKGIHDRIESSTDEYVKVLVYTQSSEDKEIKSSEIKTLAEEINHLYDSITLESDILDSTLNTQQEELKRKEAEKRKREEEEEQQKKLSEQERAAKMAKVQGEIDQTYGALTGKNNFIKKTLNEINAIQMKIISSPKDVTSGDIDTLTKTIGTLEVGLTELEFYNTSIQKILEENNLSQNDEIKTKYPEIGNMNDLMQQGKEIVEIAKRTISDQQQKQKEKQEKIVNLKPKMDAFKNMIKTLTKEIMDNMGKLTSDDEEIKLDDARKIIELLTTQYKTVERKNTLLQERIASGISDKEILTKNEEIQSLFETLKIRFETAQGLYNELNTSSTTRQVKVKEKAITEEPNILNKVTVTKPDIYINRSNPTDSRRQRLQANDSDETEGKEGNEEQLNPLVKPSVNPDIGDTMKSENRIGERYRMKAWKGGKKTTKSRITNKKTKKRHK